MKSGGGQAYAKTGRMVFAGAAVPPLLLSALIFLQKSLEIENMFVYNIVR